MVWTPNACRLEADLFEQAAQWISLQSDKDELLATARSLRSRAEAMESRVNCSAASAPDGAAPDQVIDLEAG